jgi:hypothetical protein
MNSPTYTESQRDAILDAADFFELEIACKCLGSDWATGVADRSLKGLRLAALALMDARNAQ